MEFSSMEEVVRYVKNQMPKVSLEVSKKMVEVMKNETKREQYSTYTPTQYSRTGKLIDSVQPFSVSSDTIIVGWRNLGWSSYDGKKSVYALWSLENGTTYADRMKEPSGYRPKTSIVDRSYQKVGQEIPKCFKSAMRSCGIPIV